MGANLGAPLHKNKITKRKITIIVLDTKIANTVFYQDVIQDEDGLSHQHEDVTNFSKDDVIVLPYSSGTTGLPKGILLPSSHKVMNRYVNANLIP